jgi:hypothetical protein
VGLSEEEGENNSVASSLSATPTPIPESSPTPQPKPTAMPSNPLEDATKAYDEYVSKNEKTMDIDKLIGLVFVGQLERSLFT